ncbi:MAG: MBL fold metallo-hydrolase [Chthonomonadales bacterium]
MGKEWDLDLLICGTSAAEAWPAIFCTCEACTRARRQGGKNRRTRAAYMLGDRVRVDFGPDTNCHQLHYNLDLGALEHILVTHSHDDHWSPMDLNYRSPGFSDVPDHLLTVWGNEAVERSLSEACGTDLARLRLKFHRIEAFREADLGNGAVAIPVPAAHDPKELCVNYRLHVGGRTLLLGHDTGWYPEDTWAFLGGVPLHVVILDCTYGPVESCEGHMGCSYVVRARDELARRGALAPDARVIATHFSHNGGWLHEDLEDYFAPHGIEVAYDGMRIPL